MRRWMFRCTVIAVLVTGSSLAIARSAGPPPSHTGALTVGGVAQELSCRACHSSFALNVPGATLEILDVPQFYHPDSLYTLRVRMTSTFAPPRRWGFQITAVRQADGQGVGTFDITGITDVQIVAGEGGYATRRYVEHVSAGTYPNNDGPIEWTLRWRAPGSDLGRIFFFAAGNAANSNGNTGGDHIYTKRDTTDAQVPADVPGGPLASGDVLEQATPNPFRSTTSLGYTLTHEGTVDLSVFDAQGRRVRTLVSGTRPAGRGSASWDGRRDDGTGAGAGVYFARMTVSGAMPVAPRRVVLTR